MSEAAYHKYWYKLTVFSCLKPCGLLASSLFLLYLVFFLICYIFIKICFDIYNHKVNCQRSWCCLYTLIMSLVALTGDKPKHINIFVSILSFQISNDFTIYFLSPMWYDLRIYIGLANVFRTEIITSMITDKGLQRGMWAKHNRICVLYEIKFKKTHLFIIILWKEG